MKVLNVDFPETIQDFKPNSTVFVLDRFVGNELSSFSEDGWLLISPGIVNLEDVERLKKQWPTKEKFRVREVAASVYVAEACRIPAISLTASINRTIFLQKWHSRF